MDEILKLNEMIRSHCRPRKLRIADAYAQFDDGNHLLMKEYSQCDGGHLNAKGYAKLGLFIKSQVVDLLKTGQTIACLGDSITEGYPGHFVGQEEFREYDPYPMFLEKPGVKVLNFGKSGDTSEGMTVRFYRDVLKVHPGVCIILGGVNDLFGGIEPKTVMEALAALYADCDRHQIVPVAVTVLPID